MLDARPRWNMRGVTLLLMILVAIVGYFSGKRAESQALHKAYLNELDARVDDLEVTIFGGTLNESQPESISDIEGRIQAVEVQVHQGKSDELLYRVTEDSRIFEVHKNSESLTGVFTEEQHARFIAAAKLGDAEAKRRVLAEVLYSQYADPAAASDLQFPLPEDSSAAQARRESETIRDNNISQNWRE